MARMCMECVKIEDSCACLRQEEQIMGQTCGLSCVSDGLV